MPVKVGRTPVGWDISSPFLPVGNTIPPWVGSIPFQLLWIRFGSMIKFLVGVGRVSQPTLSFGVTPLQTGSIFSRIPLRVTSTTTRTILGRIFSLFAFAIAISDDKAVPHGKAMVAALS